MIVTMATTNRYSAIRQFIIIETVDDLVSERVGCNF
jgi:hypothetical protein